MSNYNERKRFVFWTFKMENKIKQIVFKVERILAEDR